jgi:hypothetical protein
MAEARSRKPKAGSPKPEAGKTPRLFYRLSRKKGAGRLRRHENAREMRSSEGHTKTCFS